MNLRIFKGGVLDTVQDMGRYGWQPSGVNPGGAIDKVSARVANILVGNSSNEAVIEIHFPASAFFFEKPALIAIAGADFSASINGEPVPHLHPILLNKFSILQFQGVEKGTRAYLAVHGGLDLPPWLGSYSTQLKAAIGGYKGRPLQKEDEIQLKPSHDFSVGLGKKEFEVLPWKVDMNWGDPTGEETFILPGNEWSWLTEKSRSQLTKESFTITSQSDRMGYCLKGRPLSRSSKEELVSSAVTFGTMQLLPDGQVIVLMADHQTTGGYPRIGHVISAHHSRLAQMGAGESLQFRVADIGTAEKLFLKQQHHLALLQDACKLKLDNLLHAYH